MAIAMRTFGNTLSELQAGTNADKGLDYQRANAQDAINQARLEAFMRLQGQKYQTQAQQSEQAANRAQRMAELLQQIEANRELTQMDAKSRLEVAKAMAEGRAVDPRIAGLKLELEQEETENRALSEARKKIFDEMKLLEKAQSANWWRDRGEPNDIGAIFSSSRYGQLKEALAKMDAAAAERQLTPDSDGWYVGYKLATPVIPVQPNSATPVNPVPAMIPTVPAPAPAPTGAAYMGMGGMLPSSAIRTPAPVPSLFDTSIPRLRPQGATNRFELTPDGWRPF